VGTVSGTDIFLNYNANFDMRGEYKMSRLIELLRKELDISNDICTDLEILAATKGTFLRARVDAMLAVGDIKDVVEKETVLICRKLARLMVGRE